MGSSTEECMKLNVEEQQQEEMVDKQLTVEDDHPGDDDAGDDDDDDDSDDDSDDSSFYSSDEDDSEDYVSDDESDDESEEELNTHNSSAPQEAAYRVLNEFDILKYQVDDMTTVSSSLGVTVAEAAVILLNYHWNVRAILDRWSTDGPELFVKVGLFPSPVVEPSHAKDDVNCGTCGVTFLAEKLVSASCGHLFCRNCWTGYIEKSVEDGMGCVKLECPFPSCRAAVTPDMIFTLASDLDIVRFNHLFGQSYVEYNSKAKWCPANCRHAVLLINECCMYNITCNCLYSFCWVCREEAHQPASCFKVRNWQMQSVSQAEDWIANNRKCPSCDRPTHISRRGGFTECYFCNIQFCCLCLGYWTDDGHWEDDEFRHICSKKNLNKAERVGNIDESRIQEARGAIAKHNKCHAQWMALFMEQQLAMTEIQKLRSEKILVKVTATYRLAPEEVRFIWIIWHQIVECKRVLKWTNVEDQYLPPDKIQKKYHLQYFQRQVKIMTDRLCERANSMKFFLNLDGPSEQFADFRKRICLETSVVHNYLKNMIYAYKMEPADMNALRAIMRAPPPGSTTANNMTNRVVNGEGLWRCTYCRFPNHASTFICVMCYH